MRTAALIVLLSGVTAGLAVCWIAEDEAVNPAISEMLLSKPHNRMVERMGGKAMMLFVELDEWFRGLWQGKRLGATIIFLSLSASGVLYLVGRKPD